jgi:hypothetical protein
MALIRIIVSLILWFPVAVLVVWGTSVLVESINFSWIWAIILALLTGWFFEIITGPGH